MWKWPCHFIVISTPWHLKQIEMKIVFWKFQKFQNICERESGRGSCFQRYTVNSVSARGNRRAGAPPVFIFPRMFENFESFKIISSFLTFSKKWLLYNSEIPKCFPHFNNSTNWNICSKLLLDSQPYVDTCFFKNYFFIVELIVVRWSLLARLAAVLIVLFSWGEIFSLSSYYSFELKK